MRPRPALLASIALVAALGGCGGGSSAPAAPGTPDNPLPATPTPAESAVGRSNEAAVAGGSAKRQGGGRDAHAGSGASAGGQGYGGLVDRQRRRPQTRFSPCNLVTAREARAIIGRPIDLPLEAPQGPTCIYRSKDGKRFVSLAVQTRDLAAAKPRLRQRTRVQLSGHTGYCGHFGQDMLYMRLAGGRVLSVGATCGIAKRFAGKAVRRLGR